MHDRRHFLKATLAGAGLLALSPRRATLERAEDRRYMVTVHDAAADQKLVIIKGDPSEVLTLCRWRLHDGIVVPL